MKVDNKLISDLAKLAKLHFDEKSSLSMQEDLKKIIGLKVNDEISEKSSKIFKEDFELSRNLKIELDKAIIL